MPFNRDGKFSEICQDFHYNEIKFFEIYETNQNNKYDKKRYDYFDNEKLVQCIVTIFGIIL